MAVPPGDTKLVDFAETRGGHETGIALIRKVRTKWDRCKIIMITGRPSASAQQWCNENGVQYFVKPIDRKTIEHMLDMRKLNAFIVHGRDLNALSKIKKVLKKLSMESVVLMELPNRGRTVTEKFEEVASECDCAVVALTPDDFGALKATATAKSRARQNVIFELGYFCGFFGRRSGKVILVEFGELEIPSDLAGVVRIDGQRKVNEIYSDIRKEIG